MRFVEIIDKNSTEWEDMKFQYKKGLTVKYSLKFGYEYGIHSYFDIYTSKDQTETEYNMTKDSWSNIMNIGQTYSWNEVRENWEEIHKEEFKKIKVEYLKREETQTKQVWGKFM